MKVDRVKADDGKDGFRIDVFPNQKYKLLDKGGDDKSGKRAPAAPTVKNAFRLKLDDLLALGSLKVCYRFRYERIGKNVKVQKPYVVTNTVITMPPKKPVRLA
eukprot:5065223-Alexandrium_andersonii.AAC.1